MPGDAALDVHVETPHDHLPPDPRKLWRSLPRVCTQDRWGYNRTRAFWFTLNFPYNHTFELHRFHEAVSILNGQNLVEDFHEKRGPDQLLEKTARYHWVLDNPDLVAVMHAIRVELTVRYVMHNVVPSDETDPFLYWLRFEWGSNGNPHAHGQIYVKGNPSFEHVAKDAETRAQLIEAGYPDAYSMSTREEAEQQLGKYYHDYVKEWHPSKDAAGKQLYPFRAEALTAKKTTNAQPHCCDLLELLERTLAPETTDLSELRQLLLALIEDGQRHTFHAHHQAPVPGVNSCARRGRNSDGKEIVYCRYNFPKDLIALDWNRLGQVVDDKHRPGLRNLLLPRNDSLINSFEEHLLVQNLGNIDWRPLLNLWSVLEYLTKYNAKAGSGSKKLATVFADVVTNVCDWEREDGADLWRRTIMKAYSQVLGGRDYSLLETMHFGLRLPGTLSSFGQIHSVSVSDLGPTETRCSAAVYKKDRACYIPKQNRSIRRPRGSEAARSHRRRGLARHFVLCFLASLQRYFQ